MKIDPDMLAFPSTTEHGIVLGMTLRVYLAGMALQGLLASEASDDVSYTYTEAAQHAVEHADKLIAKLNEEKT